MSFVVIPAHSVTFAVSVLHSATQGFYPQIISILEENPYPSPRFAPIEARRDRRGRTYYQYFDGIVPLVFQYRVYTHDLDPQMGMVWIARALFPQDITDLE